MERWRRIDWIDEYLGLLEVSDLGKVRRGELPYKMKSRHGPEIITSKKPARILRGEVGTHGYRTIAIYTRRKRRRFLVHRLVARAFVPGFREDLSVNHINGNKTDNRSANLEWVSLSDNTRKQWETGLVNIRGNNHPSRKISSVDAAEIRRRSLSGETASSIAADYDVSDSLVWLIRDGKRWATT